MQLEVQIVSGDSDLKPGFLSNTMLLGVSQMSVSVNVPNGISFCPTRRV